MAQHPATGASPAHAVNPVNPATNFHCKKLSNERFVNNAPEKVVAMERQKLADAENKIAVIKEMLLKLN